MVVTTINERRAWRFIFISFIINIISLGIFGWSVREPTIILGAICISGYFISLIFLCYNFYSVGWEYKRINMEAEI